MMNDYINIIRHAESGSLSVCLYIEEGKVLEIGEKMNEINKNAHMNGYNWEALLNYYLEENHPDVTIGMGTDPEAGMYVAFYKLNDANEVKATKLAAIIEDLIENESKLYDIVRDNGDDIEWD